MALGLLNISSIAKADNLPWIEISKASNGHVTWYDPNEKRYMHIFEPQNNVYRSTQLVNSKVVGTAGVQSAGTVSAKVTQTVAKKSVVNGVVENAAKYGKYIKKGGKFVGTRLNIWVSATMLLYDAIKAIRKEDEQPLPPNAKIEYQPEIDRFTYSGDGHYMCIYRVYDRDWWLDSFDGNDPNIHDADSAVGGEYCLEHGNGSVLFTPVEGSLSEQPDENGDYPSDLKNVKISNNVRG